MNNRNTLGTIGTVGDPRIVQPAVNTRSEQQPWRPDLRVRDLDTSGRVVFKHSDQISFRNGA